MKSTSQARDEIWRAIAAWQDAEGKKGPSALAVASSISLSMLYKFKGKNRLGPDSVSALKPHLREISDETWLAAMGVEGECADAAAL